MARKKKAFSKLKLSTQLNYLYKAKKNLMENRDTLRSELLNLSSETRSLFEDETSVIEIKYKHAREYLRQRSKRKVKASKSMRDLVKEFISYNKIENVKQKVNDVRVQDYIQNTQDTLIGTGNIDRDDITDDDLVTNATNYMQEIFDKMTESQKSNFFTSKYYVKVSSFYSGGALDEWIMLHDMPPQLLRLVDFVDAECPNINLNRILGNDAQYIKSILIRNRDKEN